MKVFSTIIIPRHRTLTGRNERQRKRNLYSWAHNSRIDNINNVQNEVILRDIFKCSRNVIPEVFFIVMIVD